MVVTNIFVDSEQLVKGKLFFDRIISQNTMKISVDCFQ